MRGRVAALLGRVSDRRTRLRRRLEDVFNRDVLGSVSVTASLMKVIEKSLNQEPYLLLGWSGVFAASVALFVYWEKAAEKVDDAVDKAADAADPD